MTTPLWCLLIVALLPIVLAGVGGYFRTQQLGSLDNNHPRVQALELRGIAARAYAAQANAWEALGLFTAAVAINHLAGGNAESSAFAAMLFVGARLLHAGFYIGNIAVARSLAFVIGLGCCIRLFQLGASA